MEKSAIVFLTAAAAAAVLPLRGAAAPAEDLKPKVLVVMLDGVRGDAVENAIAPNLLKLRTGKWQPGYKGAWTFTANTIPDAVASSAPNHTSIATGVTAAKTNVRANGQFKRCDYGKWPSWLVRAVKARPGTKALFVFSWGPDRELSPHKDVEFMNKGDIGNGKEMAKRLSAPDAPDATLVFIDLPDHGGHGWGFYPYSTGYLLAMHQSDGIIGKMLDAIAARPSFAQEDWLVIVTSDHGGYACSHGMMGGPATTIPFILAGRNVAPGLIPGTPHNYDAAPTALAHFGIDVSGMELDGKVVKGGRPAPEPRALSDGLAAYLPFSGKTPANAAPGANAVKPEIFGKGARLDGRGGMFAGGLAIRPETAAGKTASAGLKLAGSEKLAFENGGDFAFTAWVRMDAPQTGDPVIVCNKDWNAGVNPGLALIAAKKANSARAPGVCFNTGLAGRKRFDLGTYDIEYNKWTFYAVSRDRDGVLCCYQGGLDGNLYCMSENAADIALSSGMPFTLGQDGTGRYKYNFSGSIDDAALWTRTLSREEIRRIYESGLKGLQIGDLLK